MTVHSAYVFYPFYECMECYLLLGFKFTQHVELLQCLPSEYCAINHFKQLQKKNLHSYI